MGEIILYTLAGKILSTLAPYALDQIGLTWCTKRELRKLEDKISTIRNILLHAQELQNNNPAVKDWLRRLKTILEEADDLFDEVATEALQREIVINKSNIRKVCNFFTSSNPVALCYSLGRNIKDIREKLEDISSEIRGFGFLVRTLDRPIIKRNEETTSFVDAQKVFGRENDKIRLTQLILSPNEKQKVNVIPIVGMGGLGKTTLAQMIFNYNIVKNYFDRLLWVCVSDEFNVERILREILKGVGIDVMNAGIEQLQLSFRRNLGDKKYFLVLDDVWNDDPVKWKKLEDLLMTGSRRSMVLVTTRDKKVASIVKTMDPYVLKGLSELECLSIFEKWAFEKGEETKHPELIKIGKEIVKKCGGVPLAAQTLGVVLYQKTSQHEWLSVRDSETWAQVQNENDIIPILKLSYDQMSSSLKECFAYCSIFRKDKLISKEQLMYHWIAHGLIQPSNKNENLEDVCETYLGDLLRRFFLEYSDHRCLYFKMHDLVHDLAQYVAGIENLIVKDENALAASDRVRHMSFNCDSKVPNRIIKEKKLRTVLSTYRLPFISVTCKGISSCRTLRVLEYERYSSSTDLPGNVKKLKHLRYLRFCSIKGVPKSICNLLNLQFLDLKISMIGEVHSLGNLRKLRVLKISTNLIHLPEGIQKLVSLRKLVIMDSHMLRNLGMELRNISSLLHLEILNCDQLEFSGLDFQELRRLKYLKLRGLPRLNQLPMGLNDSAVTLTHLILGDCNNMTLTEDVLPNLESLEVLEIHYCEMYTCLPEGMLCLKKLNRLEIDDYSHWETEHCSLLSKRCQPMGMDWHKIAHVPHICINGKDVNSNTSTGAPDR